MEPTLPMPHGSPEMGPILPRSPEGSPAQNNEVETNRERPAQQEKISNSTDGSAPPMPVVPLPSTQPTPAHTTPVQQVSLSDDDSPVVAADEDLIEKEWVEKAKRVISETKHDPYAQEKAISRLQADYLHKRYGKVIKLPREE